MCDCVSVCKVYVCKYAYCQGLSLEVSYTPPTLTCQRISTDVVVCGVTDRIVGASSGAAATEVRKWAKLT